MAKIHLKNNTVLNLPLTEALDFIALYSNQVVPQKSEVPMPKRRKQKD